MKDNKCILIGNEGSFFDFTSKFLAMSGFDLITFGINKREFDLNFFLNSMFAKINLNDFFSIIYISGEIAIKERMHVFNYLIPKILVLLCSKYSIRFIYLSSLASLGEHIQGPVYFSNRNSLNMSLYGETKNNFDMYIDKNFKLRSLAFGIYPASIIGVNHQNSSLQKVLKVYKKFNFLKYISFKTVLHFCHREQIASSIVFCLKSPNSFDIIIAENSSISDIMAINYSGKAIINVPSLIGLYKLIRLFLPINYITRFKGFASEAVYLNSNISLIDLKTPTEFTLKILDE
jgi:hypothetical protein